MKKIIIVGITIALVAVYIVLTLLQSEPVPPLPVESNEPSVGDIESSEKLWTSQMFFEKSNIAIVLKDTPPANTSIQIDPHYEFISFGSTDEGTTLFPLFWDIESNITAESFLARISFPFDLGTVPEIDGDGFSLHVFEYDFSDKKWNKLQSVVDNENKRIYIQVSNFSRYALGFSSVTN